MFPYVLFGKETRKVTIEFFNPPYRQVFYVFEIGLVHQAWVLPIDIEWLNSGSGILQNGNERQLVDRVQSERQIEVQGFFHGRQEDRYLGVQ